MNIKLVQSYPCTTLRGSLQRSLLFKPQKQQTIALLSQNWPLHDLNIFIDIDCAISTLLQNSTILAQRIAVANRSAEGITEDNYRLNGTLRELETVSKKMQFYKLRFSSDTLVRLQRIIETIYKYGSFESINLTAEIEKHCSQAGQRQETSIEAAMKDLLLKMCKKILKGLKDQMYCPSEKLASKLMKHYDIDYNWTLTEQQNVILASSTQNDNEKEVVRLCIRSLLPLKTIDGVCSLLLFMKRIQQNENTGVLTSDQSTWKQTYEVSQKIYCRREQVRSRQLLELDQVLNGSLYDPEFHLFLLKNIMDPQVSLVTVNSHLKNSPKEQREELKSQAIAKLDLIIKNGPWKQIEAIIDFISFAIDTDTKVRIIEDIIKCCTSLIGSALSLQSLYDIERGLTIFLQQAAKYPKATSLIMSIQTLQSLQKQLDSKLKREGVQILYRLFNEFLRHSYSQMEEDQANLFEDQQISTLALQIVKKFSMLGFVCDKEVFKSLLEFVKTKAGAELKKIYWQELVTVYLAESYSQNADLELIHSEPASKEVLADQVVNSLQRLSKVQAEERAQLTFILENQSLGSQNYRNSYLAVRSAKDQLLFASLQTLAATLHPSLPLPKTFNFSLTYCTPFIGMISWKQQQDTSCIQSRISQGYPIEVLKILYRQLAGGIDLNITELLTIPVNFWSQERSTFIVRMQQAKLNLKQFDALALLRRFEYFVSLMTCVFDKLNEQSQKNIKQIRIIYEKTSKTIIDILTQIRKPLFASLVNEIMSKCLSIPEQLGQIDLLQKNEESFINCHFIKKNYLLNLMLDFNQIGQVIGNNWHQKINQEIYYPFIEVDCASSTNLEQYLATLLQVCLLVQNTYINVQPQNCPLGRGEQWVSKALAVVRSCEQFWKQHSRPLQASSSIIAEKISNHLKIILSQHFLPGIVAFLMSAGFSKIESSPYLSLLQTSIVLVHQLDAQYEDHFILLMEAFERGINKGEKDDMNEAKRNTILSTLNVFFELIMSGIRIRSYHVFKLIKLSLAFTKDEPTAFNNVIAEHIQSLLAHFLPGRKLFAEITRMCSKNFYQQTSLGKCVTQLNTISCACTLSMFINLFCRLNFTNLSTGVEQIFVQEQTRMTYIDYLSQLTRRVDQGLLIINQKQRQIFKIDVYGNLSTVTRGKISGQLLTKWVVLAKQLLQASYPLANVTKLPMNMLVQKIVSEDIEIDLQQFQDQELSISLGVISVHRKISQYVHSNLLIANLFYISERGPDRNLDLNKLALAKFSKKYVKTEIDKLKQGGLQQARVHIEQPAFDAVNCLISKIATYYNQMKIKGEPGKLYAAWKVLCLTCLNIPELIPHVTSKKVKINTTQVPFLDLVLDTLKICLPLFCEFYIALIKSNGRFISLPNKEYCSLSLQLEMSIRTSLLSRLTNQLQGEEQDMPHLLDAISFTMRYSQSYRFRAYRFSKINNDRFEALTEQFETYFAEEVLKNLKEYYLNSSLKDQEYDKIFDLSEIALQRLISHDASNKLKWLLDRQLQTFISSSFDCDSLREIKPTGKKPSDRSGSKGSMDGNIKTILEILASKPKITQKRFRQKKSTQNSLASLQSYLVEPYDSAEIAKLWRQSSNQSQYNEVNKILVAKFQAYNSQVQQNLTDSSLHLYDATMAHDLYEQSGTIDDQVLIISYKNLEGDSDSIVERKQHKKTPLQAASGANDEEDVIKSYTDLKAESDSIVDKVEQKEFSQKQFNKSDTIRQSLDSIGDRQKFLAGTVDFDELIKSYKSLKVDNEDSLEVRAGTVDDSKVVKSYKVLQTCMDGIVQSQPSNSDGIIEDSIKEKEEILQDNLIVSQTSFNWQDGSIKIIPNEEIMVQEIPVVTKENLMLLIEEYGLNPEVMKVIINKIGALTTGEIKKLAELCEGPIKFALNNELKNRGLSVAPKRWDSAFEEFFIDESKFYEGVGSEGFRHDLESQQDKIPQLCPKTARQFCSSFIKNYAQEGTKDKPPRMSSLLRKLALKYTNAVLLISAAVQLLNTSNEQAANTRRYIKSVASQAIINGFFQILLQERLALPLIFFADWHYSTSTLQASTQQDIYLDTSMQTQKVISIILHSLIYQGQSPSSFIKSMEEYIKNVRRCGKYIFPYYDIQDKVKLSPTLATSLSDRLHFTGQHSSLQTLNESILSILSCLQLEQFSHFARIEFARLSEIVKKVATREQSILKLYKKHYAECEIEIERKIDIYWQLRKQKQADQFLKQLQLCRKIMVDLATRLISSLKENCFMMYYQDEDTEYKNRLAKLSRKVADCRTYEEAAHKENQLVLKDNEYVAWKKNLINEVIRDQINPVLEFVAEPLLKEIIEAEWIFGDIAEQFVDFPEASPLLYRQCNEIYKLMLAYELMTREEEHTFHSMSQLKTNPSINSMKDTITGRRRSTLREKRTSVILNAGSSLSLTNVLKRSAGYFSYEGAIDCKDPLYIIHAKYSAKADRIRLLQTGNSKGEKTIQVSRDSIWKDTLAAIDDDFGDMDIKVKITGELGLDYGGVTREWITLLAKQVVDPRAGLFELNANQLAFQPAKHSFLVPNHLVHFRKFGMVVGKAMKENWLLQINFTKSFLKHLLGFTLYVEDLEDISPDTAKGLLWILKNDIGEDLELTFSYDREFFGARETVDLIPDGNNIPVTEENKKDYVKRLACAKMTQQIREQAKAFMSGIEQVIPYNVLKMFTYKEVGRYLAGAPTVDINDMRQYARYEGHLKDSDVIIWFWDVLGALDEEEKGNFLFFLTGSYKVPYSGFKENPVTVNLMANCIDYLPVAHTCFSVIDLPEYSSQEKLRRQLLKAVKEGKGFSVS